MFPGAREDGFADIATMDVRGFMVDLMRALPFKARLGLRAAIWLIALAPLVVLRRFATITSLPAADGERVVATLGTSRLYAVRSLVILLKTFGCLLYAGDDAIRSRLRPAPMSTVPLRIRRAHVA
jgi:hypothetical protein